MTFECKIPELGENVQSGTVAAVLVKPGERVKKDQPLIELETEKAVVEVPAEAEGVVKEIFVQSGQKVQVGQTILVLETEAKAEAPPPPAPKAEKAPSIETAAPVAVVEIVVPNLGENVAKGTVAGVLVQVGDVIKAEQPVIELETDKAVVEVPADRGGEVVDVLVKAGDVVQTGQVILRLRSAEAGKPKVEAPAVEIRRQAPPPSQKKETVEVAPVPEETLRPAASAYPAAPAAPSVRRFAREIGVNINQVKGSGPAGRISIEDVKAYAKQLLSEPSRGAAQSTTTEPLPDFSKWGEVTRELMSSVREKTAVHLSHAWHEIPHVTQFDKADITELETLRKQYAPRVEQAGGKLTITAILLKTVASALKLYPQFNASVDMRTKEIIYKKYYHIGVAVDTPRGLLVPVIRDVDRKNLTELAVELAQISQKARDRKLTLEDMSGGNFTISNLGG
ncbi:MAG: 2-oxo acid dehydrogenase subunit E2, partial [candidate division KSB1 bacterium]|nr:2-oxo acid dehydrogenase subunit E2 [candidate division KSB1 bacterium]